MQKIHPLINVISFYQSLKEYNAKLSKGDIVRSRAALANFVEAMHSRGFVEDTIACHFSVDWANYLSRLLDKACDEAHWSDTTKTLPFFSFGLADSARRSILITRTIVQHWLNALDKEAGDGLAQAVPLSSIEFLEWLSTQNGHVSLARIPQALLGHDVLITCEALGLAQFSIWTLEEDPAIEGGYVRAWFWLEEVLSFAFPLHPNMVDRNAPGDPADHPYVRLSEMGFKILDQRQAALSTTIANKSERRESYRSVLTILAGPDIQVDPKLQTISIGSRVLQWGGSVAWESFYKLWRARPNPVDLRELMAHTKPSDIVSEIRKFLRKNGLEQVANALKVSKNVGYYFDLPV